MSSSQTSPSPIDVFKKICIFFFSGVAIFIAMTFLVYGLTLLVDRYCICCVPESQSSDDGDDVVDLGPVARKAGLWQLSLAERKLILKSLFLPSVYRDVKTTTPLTTNHNDGCCDNKIQRSTTKNDDDDNHDDIEYQRPMIPSEDAEIKTAFATTTLKTFRHESSPQNPNVLMASELVVPDTTRDAPSNSVVEGSSTGNEVVPHNNDTGDTIIYKQSQQDGCSYYSSSGVTTDKDYGNETMSKEGKVDFSLFGVLDDADHARTCAICLRDYMDTDQVVSGKNCSHLFHFDCVMAWLERHDHCPFCRKEMMTALQMRMAAIQIFGEDHVFQLGPPQRIIEAMATTDPTPVAEFTTTTTTTTTTVSDGPPRSDS